MNRFIFMLGCLSSVGIQAQRIDSIYFHLYTNSLKKGVHNYINVDGKLANGKYLPLNSRQIKFRSNTGKWEGNDLIIDVAYAGDSVLVEAVLIERQDIFKRITIYIKKKPDDAVLPYPEEILKKEKP